MGRKRNPIEDINAVARFAKMLRDRIDGVDETYRQIATKANYSHSSVAKAASGKRLPTWNLTQAILAGCNADPDELTWWREQWENARRLNNDPSQSDKEDWDDDLRWGLVAPPTRGYRQWRPQPETVETFEDLVYELKRFRIAAGNPSLRQLQYEMKRHSFGQPCSISALSEALSGKRRPKIEVFRALINALFLRMHLFHGHNEKGRPWTTDSAWFDAWTRAEFHRERPGPPPGRDSMPSFVAAPAANGNDIKEMAEQDPVLAAKFFVDMDPKEAKPLIAALPPEIAVILLTAVFTEQQAQLRRNSWTPDPPGPGAPEQH